MKEERMSQKAIEQLCTNWQSALMENREALHLLDELRQINRREKFKDLELGLARVPEKNDLPENIYQSLKSFGLIDGKITGMVSIPLRKKDNRISNFYFVSLNGASTGSATEDKIIRQGGVINFKAFMVFKKLVIVDTMADYFAYFQQVKENIVPLIQSTWMPDDLAIMIRHSSTEEIVLLNDSPYWELLKSKLAGSDVNIFEIKLPDGKSVKEYLSSNSPNKLTAYLDSARHKYLEGEKAKILKAAKESEAEPFKEYLNVIEETGQIKFVDEDRTYLVRGFHKDGFEKIVQLSLEIDGFAFPDKVDLSRSQSRQRFANIAGSEFEISSDIIRNDLTFIYKTLDKMQDERFREKIGLQEKNVHIITRDDESKAIDRLTSRDILNEILIKDTERLGYVEEEVNKKLFYIAATSRMTGKPLSVLDISPPGTGKSFGLSMIMDFMPPDEVLKYSRLSPQALYYKQENELQGRVLYIEELVGMEESLEPIRMLLSSGELAVSVVEKDPRTGTLRTVERRIKVDIPILSSGVRDLFDEETLSRFILTYNDLTMKHVERILKSQSFKYSLDGEKVLKQRDRFLKKHRDMQKVLDPTVSVVNPFAEKIMVNPHLHIVTRKQEQYLRLIYNIAFLRQHSREKKQAEDRFGNIFTYIEANREDVETANEIADYVFQFARGDLTKRLFDAYQVIEGYCRRQVKEKRINLHEYKFSRREIRDHTGWEQTSAKRIFDELEALEYIRKARGDKQGMQYLYRLVAFNERSNRADDLRLLDPEAL
jgi:hypothetical protein